MAVSINKITLCAVILSVLLITLLPISGVLAEVPENNPPQIQEAKVVPNNEDTPIQDAVPLNEADETIPHHPAEHVPSSSVKGDVDSNKALDEADAALEQKGQEPEHKVVDAVPLDETDKEDIEKDGAASQNPPDDIDEQAVHEPKDNGKSVSQNANNKQIDPVVEDAVPLGEVDDEVNRPLDEANNPKTDVSGGDSPTQNAPVRDRQIETQLKESGETDLIPLDSPDENDEVQNPSENDKPIENPSEGNSQMENPPNEDKQVKTDLIPLDPTDQNTLIENIPIENPPERSTQMENPDGDTHAETDLIPLDPTDESSLKEDKPIENPPETDKPIQNQPESETPNESQLEEDKEIGTDLIPLDSKKDPKGDDAIKISPEGEKPVENQSEEGKPSENPPEADKPEAEEVEVDEKDLVPLEGDSENKEKDVVAPEGENIPMEGRPEEELPKNINNSTKDEESPAHDTGVVLPGTADESEALELEIDEAPDTQKDGEMSDKAMSPGVAQPVPQENTDTDADDPSVIIIPAGQNDEANAQPNPVGAEQAPGTNVSQPEEQNNDEPVIPPEIDDIDIEAIIEPDPEVEDVSSSEQKGGDKDELRSSVPLLRSDIPGIAPDVPDSHTNKSKPEEDNIEVPDVDPQDAGTDSEGEEVINNDDGVLSEPELDKSLVGKVSPNNNTDSQSTDDLLLGLGLNNAGEPLNDTSNSETEVIAPPMPANHSLKGDSENLNSSSSDDTVPVPLPSQDEPDVAGSLDTNTLVQDEPKAGEAKGEAAEEDNGFQWTILVAAIISGLVCFVLGLIASACYHKSSSGAAPHRRSPLREAEIESGSARSPFDNGKPNEQSRMLPANVPRRPHKPDSTKPGSKSRRPNSGSETDGVFPNGIRRDPAERSHTFPKMQRKTFYDSRELSYIDEASDDEEAKQLGRPPYVGYERKPSVKKAKNAKKRLSKLLDGPENPVNLDLDAIDPYVDFPKAVENLRRSLIEAEPYAIDYMQEPENSETAKLLGAMPSNDTKIDNSPKEPEVPETPKLVVTTPNNDNIDIKIDVTDSSKTTPNDINHPPRNFLDSAYEDSLNDLMKYYDP